MTRGDVEDNLRHALRSARAAGAEHADTHVLQLHGFKADDTDPEFSVSDGTTADSSDKAYLPNAFYQDLQGRMQIATPGLTRNGNSCNQVGHASFKCGTDSVQGREFNGTENACTTDAPDANGRFLHLEMSNDLREPDGSYSQQLVIETVKTVFPKKAEAGDRIWADADGDGVQDPGEPGIHGVTVEVLDTNDDVVESTSSIVGGYRIGNLEPGTYRLRVQVPAGYSAGTGFDANGRATGTFILAAGESLLTVDAPLVPPALGEIGDRVWNDADRDGLQETGDGGLASVTVRLLTSDDATVATGATDFQGLYSFTGVLPGDYKVSVEPGVKGFTQQVFGSPDDDSDIEPLTGASWLRNRRYW